MTTDVSLHEHLAPLAALVGTFEGEGRGDYPTIDAFAYHERVRFEHDGRGFLAYEQWTWRPDGGAPMHRERGYLRVPAHGRVELVLAHATGVVEVQEGTLQGTYLSLRSTGLASSATAKVIGSLRRTFELDGDALRTDLWMAYGDVAETHHLASVLHRTG